MPAPDLRSGAFVSAAAVGSEMPPLMLVLPLVTLNVPLALADAWMLSGALMTFVPAPL